VDGFTEAKSLLAEKRYYPVYVQEFVPMAADIRIMLIGHKPVCAFWRRPPEGEWLTNTSQGGSMDYQNVPQKALDIAVKASRAANAEYWACDIALGTDGKFRILECATAFAAFPYIRDWIGQYLMWQLSNGQMKAPNIPMYNWEELSKIRSGLLRTMRHITFGEYKPSQDCADVLTEADVYQLLPMELRLKEEWPSEIWNFQDNYVCKARLGAQVQKLELEEVETGAEDSEEFQQETGVNKLNAAELKAFFRSVKGIGDKMYQAIMDSLGVDGVNRALQGQPELFLQVPNLKQKKLATITSQVSTMWPRFGQDK